MKITIGYLYGDLMNIYGDLGNIIALKKRAEWRGIEVKIKNISVGDKIKPGDCDLYFFGGGQDQAQELVARDLGKSGKGKVIKKEIERGVPLLSICGGYQLLGEYYQPASPARGQGGPHKGTKLPGIGIFPAYTKASDERMIGNVVIELTSELVNQLTRNPSQPVNQSTSQLLVGFENHSGKTYLKKGGKALGTVIKGFGNNGKDQTEGVIYKNAIGCYMHGSLLPKNPKLADWLLKKALEVKYGKEIILKPLNDSLESQTHTAAVQKFS